MPTHILTIAGTGLATLTHSEAELDFSFYWYDETPHEVEVRDGLGLVIDTLPLVYGEGPLQNYITVVAEKFVAERGLHISDFHIDWE